MNRTLSQNPDVNRSVAAQTPGPVPANVEAPTSSTVIGLPMFLFRKANGAVKNDKASNKDAVSSSNVETLSRLTKTSALYAKLDISQPTDRSEIEADQIANRIMHMEDPTSVSPLQVNIGDHRACASCKESEALCLSYPETDKVFRRVRSATYSPPLTSSRLPNIGLQGGGEPLPTTEREFFEPRFGVDLGHVRVHAGQAAADAAWAINAKAFTVGNDIAFAAGELRPSHSEGRRLLAHELTHVLQQNEQSEMETVHRFGDDPDPLPVAGEVMDVVAGATAGDVPLSGDERVIVVSWFPRDADALVELPPPYIHAYRPFRISKGLLRRRNMWSEPVISEAVMGEVEAVMSALAEVDPIAGVGNFASVFRVLDNLAMRELLAVSYDLDRRYMIDLLRANIGVSHAAARVEAGLLAGRYRNQRGLNDAEREDFSRITSTLDAETLRAVGAFVGEANYMALTGMHPERERIYIVHAGEDDFIISFSLEGGRSNNVMVTISPADLSRAYQSETRYWDYRGAPTDSRGDAITVGSWSVPAIPFTRRAITTHPVGFNPVLLSDLPESAAHVWTFDWDGDETPDYGVRIEFDRCLYGTWEQFRYQSPPAGHRYCNISREYRFTAARGSDVSRFRYHFIHDDAWRFGYMGNVSPRLQEDSLAGLRMATEMAITMIPIVGEIVLLTEAITGRTLFGDRLSTTGRVIAAIAALLPVVGGVIARTGARAGADLITLATRLGRSEEEVIAILRAVEQRGGANARNLERWGETLRSGGRLTAQEVIELRQLLQQIDLDVRIVRAETLGAVSFEAQAQRLDTIIRTGGAMPQETRVIGAAIVDVPGYTGPTEIRAISSAATDALGEGASVAHATTPATRTLSTARSMSGATAHGEFPFSHVNDAEIKLLEMIRPHLPPNATGRIHILSLRSRAGGTIIEPIPICSSCTHAIFQQVGDFPGVTVVSHSTTFPPMARVDLAP